MDEICEIIKAELAQNGPIPFHRFMELALYCPNFGYYERLDVTPGRKGDFYTSVSAGELFGQLLANQFAVWLQELAGKPCQILEAGAHDGKLAKDILRELKLRQPKLFGSLEYWILEPARTRQKWQEETLLEFADSVRWFESWEALPQSGVSGIILSNELLDAMPVNRIGWDAVNKKWFEWGVDFQNEKFVFTKLSNGRAWNKNDFCISSEQGSNESLGQLFEILPDGFITELSPKATAWWSEAAKVLRDGKMITFDYGLVGEQFFTPERKRGTLRAYYHHRQTDDVLAQPGNQDITAQVNFGAIIQTGEKEGLKTETFTTQARFLTGLVQDLCKRNLSFEEWITARSRAFQTLTHPDHLGQSFSMLVQSR